jgi:hypothetical protein
MCCKLVVTDEGQEVISKKTDISWSKPASEFLRNWVSRF